MDLIPASACKRTDRPYTRTTCTAPFERVFAFILCDSIVWWIFHLHSSFVLRCGCQTFSSFHWGSFQIALLTVDEVLYFVVHSCKTLLQSTRPTIPRSPKQTAPPAQSGKRRGKCFLQDHHGRTIVPGDEENSFVRYSSGARPLAKAVAMRE